MVFSSDPLVDPLNLGPCGASNIRENGKPACRFCFGELPIRDWRRKWNGLGEGGSGFSKIMIIIIFLLFCPPWTVRGWLRCRCEHQGYRLWDIAANFRRFNLRPSGEVRFEDCGLDRVLVDLHGALGCRCRGSRLDGFYPMRRSGS